MTNTEALEYMRENDVKFVRLQFVDILGRPKNIAITINQMEKTIGDGIVFDASSVAGFGDVAHSDMLLLPDLSTIRILPWRPQNGKVARILCKVLHPDGAPFPGDCRSLLQSVQQQAEDRGMTLQIGPECEFFLFKYGDDGQCTTQPQDSAGYADVAPVDSGENVRREICLTLEEMGLQVEASHHESGKGQNEVDFRYSSPLAAADNLITLKTAVQTIAQRNGLLASFMPKPLMDDCGSGLHINISLDDRDGKPVFGNGGVISGEGGHFLAGMLHFSREICAVTNPLVNSYKRLGYGHNAPGPVSWGRQNRSALVRVPQTPDGRIRLEARAADPACNPYLAFALLCQAGFYGMEHKLTLEPPVEINAYQLPEDSANRLPATLREAVGLMRDSAFVRQCLGESIFKYYIASKTGEWNRYNQVVHQWELDQYLTAY